MYGRASSNLMTSTRMMSDRGGHDDDLGGQGVPVDGRAIEGAWAAWATSAPGRAASRARTPVSPRR